MTRIQMRATVGPDGTLDLRVPDLLPGESLTITIETEQTAPAHPAPAHVHIIDLVKDPPGHRLFKTAGDVDRYLREERKSWDR